MDEQEKTIRINYIHEMMHYKFEKFNTLFEELASMTGTKDPNYLEPVLTLLNEMVGINKEGIALYEEYKSLVEEISPNPLP